MLHDIGQSLTALLAPFHALAYWLAFAAALLETTLVVGLLVPGSTFILVLGALCARGDLALPGVLCFAALGALLGDNANYWLGRRYGQRWIDRGVWFLRAEHLDRARRFLDAHGARSVFLGRFVPGLKELVPFVAGTVGMHRPTFLLWNLIGALGWAVEWAGAGFVFAASLNLAQLWLSRAALVIATLLVVSVAMLWARQLVVRHGQVWWRVAVSLAYSVGRAVAGNREVRALVERHPRAFAFLRARLDRRRFEGLPLTLLGLAMLYLVVLFAGLIEDVLTADPIVVVDRNLASVMMRVRTPGLVHAAIWVTDLGAAPMIALFLLTASLGLWLAGRGTLTAGLVASTVGAAVTTTLGKWAIHRPRPPGAVLLEHSWAFPSGHATAAMAFYGFIAYVLVQLVRSWRGRVNAVFGVAIVILLIGASRIVLGVHYLSDVLAGYLVGGLWLVAGVTVDQWLLARYGTPRRVPIRHPRALQAALGATALGAFVAYAVLHHPSLAPPPGGRNAGGAWRRGGVSAGPRPTVHADRTRPAPAARRPGHDRPRRADLRCLQACGLAPTDALSSRGGAEGTARTVPPGGPAAGSDVLAQPAPGPGFPEDDRCRRVAGTAHRALVAHALPGGDPARVRWRCGAFRGAQVADDPQAGPGSGRGPGGSGSRHPRCRVGHRYAHGAVRGTVGWQHVHGAGVLHARLRDGRAVAIGITTGQARRCV